MLETKYFEGYELENPFDFAMECSAFLGPEEIPDDVFEFISEQYEGFTMMSNIYSLVFRAHNEEIIAVNCFSIHGEEYPNPYLLTELRVVEPKFSNKGLGTYLSALTVKMIHDHPDTEGFPVKDSFVADGNTNAVRLKEKTDRITKSVESLTAYWQKFVLEKIEKSD